MTQTFRRVCVVVFACVTLWHCAACASPDKTTTALALLQEGNARGHLVMTTSAALSVGTQTDFYVGARGTKISFDGDIDFRDADFRELDEALKKAAEGGE